MKLNPFIAAALLIIPVSAMAQDSSNNTWSGNNMYQACKNYANYTKDDLQNQSMCLGIVGAIRYFSDGRFGFCTPDGVTTSQALRIVVKYMDDNPAVLHEDLREITVDALRSAWPCKNQEPHKSR
jgi:hypothetical protein